MHPVEFEKGLRVDIVAALNTCNWKLSVERFMKHQLLEWNWL